MSNAGFLSRIEDISNRILPTGNEINSSESAGSYDAVRTYTRFVSINRACIHFLKTYIFEKQLDNVAIR